MTPELRYAISGYVRDEYFEAWMDVPHPMLGGRPARNVIEEEGELPIWRILHEVSRCDGPLPTHENLDWWVRMYIPKFFDPDWENPHVKVDAQGS